MATTERTSTTGSLKPLHLVTARIERTRHDAIRAELPIIVRLAEQATDRRGECSEHLQQLQQAMSHLHDAVIAHFDREEALLFPTARLLEDRVRVGWLNLPLLCAELRGEHDEILWQLRLIRRMTQTGLPCTPLFSALVTALAGLARELAEMFEEEELTVYPDAITLQQAMLPRTSLATVEH